MRRVMLSLASGWFLVAAAGAPPALAVEGEAWDEGHMRSRYRGLLERPLRPAEVRGGDRYGAIADVPAAASIRVPETLSSVTQRSWKSGPVGAVARRSNGFQRSFVGGGRRTGSPGSSLGGSRSRGGVLRQGSR